jgi:hypothetical protein
MAAAILMMNMQGAVMAADKDSTIFRYSDKVPFALITDPTSKLPWDDIWNEFRLSFQMIDDYVDTFITFMRDRLSKEEKNISKEQIVLVYYQPNKIFPESHSLFLEMIDGELIIEVDEQDSIISAFHTTHVQRIGDFENMSTLLDGSINNMRKDLLDKFNDLRDSIIDSTKNGKQKLKIDFAFSEIKPEVETLIQTYHEKYEEGIFKAISCSHIEDMVRMAENLVDAEGQQHHLQHPDEETTKTKEIATVTLAEGFRWIKHSLYGA